MTTTLVSARVNQAKREALNPILEGLGVSFSAFVSDAIDSVLQTKQLPTESAQVRNTENISTADMHSQTKRQDVQEFIRTTTLNIDWATAPDHSNTIMEDAWLRGDYKTFVREGKYQDYLSLGIEPAAKDQR